MQDLQRPLNPTTTRWLVRQLRQMDWIERHFYLNEVLAPRRPMFAWAAIFAMGPDELYEGGDECEFPATDDPIPLPDASPRYRAWLRQRQA